MTEKLIQVSVTVLTAYVEFCK